MKWTTLALVGMTTGSLWGAQGTINVDLQPGPTGSDYSANYQGQGGLSDPGNDTWNAVMPPVDGYVSTWGSGGNFNFTDLFTSEPLFDSSGQATPMTISIAKGHPRGTTFAVNPSNTWAYDHVASDAKNLMSDYLIAPGGVTNHVQIHQLATGARYTLVLYGAGDQNTHRTSFTVGTNTLTTMGAPNDMHTMTEGGDYVIFRDVVAENGSLTIYYTGAGLSFDGNFNGFQLRGEWTTKPAGVPSVPENAKP